MLRVSKLLNILKKVIAGFIQFLQLCLLNAKNECRCFTPRNPLDIVSFAGVLLTDAYRGCQLGTDGFYPDASPACSGACRALYWE